MLKLRIQKLFAIYTFGIFLLTVPCGHLLGDEPAVVRGKLPIKSFQQRLMSFDSNRDELIQRNELPLKHHKHFDAWDTDANSVLDQGEQFKMVYFQMNGRLPSELKDHESVTGLANRIPVVKSFGGLDNEKSSQGCAVVASVPIEIKSTTSAWPRQIPRPQLQVPGINTSRINPYGPRNWRTGNGRIHSGGT